MSLGFETLKYTWHIDPNRPIVIKANTALDGKIMVLEEVVVRFVTVPHVPFRRLPIETYLHICAKISEFGISFLGNGQIYSANGRGALSPTSVKLNVKYQRKGDIHPSKASVLQCLAF
jgi:hypothetical protein